MAVSGQLSWSDLIDLLSTDKRKSIKTLDTVFVSPGDQTLQWYFTNKSGSVSKKKKDSTSVDNIIDRFSRFALSNPFNSEGIVGVLVDISTGLRKWMRKDDLSACLATNINDLDKPGMFLQVYLRPLRGADVVFSCESSRLDDTQYNHEIIVVHHSHNAGRDSGAKHEVTDSIQAQITEMSESILACLRETHHLEIDQLTIECIVDDNQHAWLSSISHCEMASDEVQEPTDSNEQLVKANLGSSSNEMQALQMNASFSEMQRTITNNTAHNTETHMQDSPSRGAFVGSKLEGKKEHSSHKKKKKDLKTGDSGFRRSLLDEPPNIEMMAKFAAEKERQERMMYQQEGPEYLSDSSPAHRAGGGGGGAPSKAAGGPKRGKKKQQQGDAHKSIRRSNSGNGVPQAGGYLPSLHRHQPSNPDVAALLDPGSQMDQAERRLEELQKLASTTATIKNFVQQQQQQQQASSSGVFQGPNSAGLAIGLGLPASRLPLGSAAAAAVAQMARPGTHMGTPGTAPSRHAMSGSEADFLVRQINSATDVSQLSMFSNIDEFESVAVGLDGGIAGASAGMGAGLVAGGDSVWSTDGFVGGPAPGLNQSSYQSYAGAGSVAEVLSDTLKEKIANLERQVSSLNSALARKEAELDKKDAKVKKLNSEVDTLRRDNANEMRSLSAEHELAMLRLKEIHSKEKSALMLGGPIKPDSTEGSPQKTPLGRPGQSAAGGGSSHEANSKLIEQVEALRQENRRLQDVSADERRSLLIENSNKMLAQERSLKAEILELRSAHAAFEDRITQASEELSAATAKIHALQNMNQQLEISKKSAVDTQARLRADLKNMQQSVQASYRLETSQGIGAGGGVDADTAIRLSEAKNDAKLRQLTNKLDFLKAQLDAEKKSADDARSASQMMQLKLDEMREDVKMRTLKAESDQKLAVEIAEQQLEALYSERMKELTTLQMKMHNLQGMLSDAQEQEILARQREEGARSVAAKNSSQQAALRTELEQLRSQVQIMREEKEQELLKEAGKQSQDAVIRRLDNERQYLKSQLASEVTHKSELQTAFAQCQQQLNEVQKQWKNDVDTLKDINIQANHTFADKEQKYLQLQSQLDSEVKRCQSQNKELKEGFMKMRDQVRMEQLALENANAQHRRLQEAFEEAQVDVTRLRQQEQQTAIQHKAQMDAINESVAEQERRNSLSLQSLRDELSGQFLTNAHAQTIMLRMKDEFNVEKQQLTKISGAVKLFEVLRRWRRCRVFSGFRRWHTNSNLVGAAKQFREQVEVILKKTSKDMHKDKVSALDALRAELKARHGEALQAKQGEWEEALNEAMRQADENKARELENAAEEHQAQLQQLEADFAFDMQNARKECTEEIDRAIARKDAEIEVIHQNFRVERDLAKQRAQQEQEDALIVKEQEMDEVMRQRLKLQDEDLARKHAKNLEKLAVEHDFQLHRKENAWKQETDKLKARLTAERELAVHTLNEEHKRTITDFTAQKERDIDALSEKHRLDMEAAQSKLRGEMHEATEVRIRELRVVWQEEFDARSAQLRGEFDALLTTKMDEYGKATEAEKLRSVKLEAAKWKQAMKDAGQNHELDSLKTKAEVANEKDREMRLELQRISESFEVRRKEDLAAHQATLEDVRRDHAVAFERQANAHALSTEKAKLELEIALKLKHDAFWTDKMAQELAATEANFKARSAKEQARMEQLKQDFAQQSQNFALERANLQRQVNQADERILQIEKTNKADVAALKRSHEEASRKWEEKRADELEEWEDKTARKITIARREMEDECTERAEKALQEESARLNEEMDRQVGQMQDESEKLISGLEQAMTNLKTEKGALATELENLTTKLEETEDSLYDLQQECKRVKMDSSLAVWKSVTKIFQMRQRFQEGIAQFDKEAAQRYADIKKEMQAKLDHSTFMILRLASLLQDADVARINTHAILTSHRTTELISSRNKIQVMEQDLERLTLEKDSLEEQKELLESDIVQMETQVRELEDMIRAHNQESSMSNGRINVAHARKKRRLDTELEQLLESIEQKRHTMSTMDQRVTQKGHERDDLELEMIDIERNLVAILLEQQKLILGRLDDGKMILDKTQVILGVARIKFPVPAEPMLEHVPKFIIPEFRRRVNSQGEEEFDEEEQEQERVVEKNKKAGRKS